MEGAGADHLSKIREEQLSKGTRDQLRDTAREYAISAL